MAAWFYDQFSDATALIV